MLSRRSFLQVAAAAGLITTVPVAVAVVAQHQVRRLGPIGSDYEEVVRIGAQVDANGDRYRHGCVIPSKKWAQMSSDQREEMWRLVESMVLRRV